ncbi:TrmB family transcriptional regulator [Halogeometricum limi]|uniref:Sugar-specific transcriptional regulator TrmB n=1 Tax=Halogeometricum limi TaxID=555875 RepID=A0A1I6IDG7_9EURY|nr:TrmB family transcriptional regulator sugar-binding domain-containing protein [Halogeometricum limi]SFR64817.1 Sugar-specific transcriptional regulator TrmB [Halogeometricum limi]
MAEDSLRDHLVSFGLSAKEAEAYLAILESGEATTGDVSRSAGVSQGYVYELAAELADRGLITVDEAASPTLLRARPPGEAVGTFTDRLDRMESEIATRFRQSDAGEPAVEIVHSRATVRKRIVRTLERARRDVILTLPATEFEHVRESLSEARARGVAVYLQLVAPVDRVADDVEWDRYATVAETWDARPPVTVVADEETGVMGSHSILSGRHGSAYALVFSQRDIAGGFFGNAISNFWPMGEVLHVADPDPLPATYDHVRTAVTNAALHEAAGRSLLADVTVRAVGTEETTTYERVPVVAVRQNLVGDPTNEFPIENSLVFETPDGRIAAGGNDGSLQPFYEGYAAESVTLYDAGSAGDTTSP